MRQLFLTSLIVGLLFAISAHPGELISTPVKVEADQITISVGLQDSSGQVAATNFTLIHDPSQYRPIGVVPGASAVSAGRSVQGNLAQDGQYIVVVMGLSEQTMASGEIAQIVLERLPNSGSGEGIRIDNATLATLNGESLPVQVRNPGDPEPEEEDPEPEEEEPEEETPESEEPSDTTTVEEDAVAQALLTALEQLTGVPQDPESGGAVTENAPSSPEDSVAKVTGDDKAALEQLLALRDQLPTPGTEAATEETATPGGATADRSGTSPAGLEQIHGSTGTDMTFESGNGNNQTAGDGGRSSGMTERKAALPWAIITVLSVICAIALAVLYMRSR